VELELVLNDLAVEAEWSGEGNVDAAFKG
jgi:hypothetical protein